MNYLAAGFLPYLTVEIHEFRDLIRTLDPYYTVPSEPMIRDLIIPEFYDELHQKILLDLLPIESYSLSTDLWTSKDYLDFNTTTVNFINSEWKLQRRVLDTTELAENDTGINLGKSLMDTATKWNLSNEHNLNSITSTNSILMSEAIKESEFSIHIECFAEALHLATLKGFEVSIYCLSR